MLSAPGIGLLFALGLCGCRPPAGDTSGPPAWEPARTVVLLTVDSLQAHFLWGYDQGWDTAPFLRSLFEEGVLLPNVQAARNLTGPALTSLFTGTYPRDHKVRGGDTWDPSFPLLSERFQEGGYRTLGFTTNLCELLERGFDQVECARSILPEEVDFEPRRDAMATTDLGRAIQDLDPDLPIFAWLHLNQVHFPYLVDPTWYDRFHPEPYEGSFDVEDTQDLTDVMLGSLEVSEEDLRHFHAVYASEVRAMDERVRGFVETLEAAGRWDDAVFVFGADHGEELCEHFHYIGHGCSVYQPVSQLLYLVRAPGRLPAGIALDGWVSQTDIAPTLVDLASAFEWSGFQAGRSLVDEMLAGTIDDRPAFFERGVHTAGITWQGHRLVLSGEEGFDDCCPYSQFDAVFPSELCEIYDLGADCLERTNLAEDPAHAALREELTDRVCDWVEERPWVETEQMMEDNRIVGTCAER